MSLQPENQTTKVLLRAVSGSPSPVEMTLKHSQIWVSLVVSTKPLGKR